MRRSRSERVALAGALAAALAVAAAGGCARRDIEVTPFALSVEVIEGTPVLRPPAGQTGALVTLRGAAARESPTALRVVNTDVPGYTVRLSFSNRAAPDVELPARLDGATVIVHLLTVPGAVAPGGTPIPFPAVRVATGTVSDGRYQFLLGEGSLPGPNEVAGVPRPLLQPENPPFVLPQDALPPPEDFPFCDVFADLVYFEPAECGLQYYDVLRVHPFFEGPVISVLRPGDAKEIPLFEGDPAPWTVRHVLSWHRVGSCGDDPRLWTQLAAWRK